MKKLFAVLMALITAITAVTVVTTTPTTTTTMAPVNPVAADLDRPEEAALVEWALGYKARCRHAKRARIRREKKSGTFRRLFKTVLLAPLALFVVIPAATTATTATKKTSKTTKVSKAAKEAEDAEAARQARINYCIDTMKAEPALFALPKKVAQEVAELLCGLSFDAMCNMTIDDLRRIKGIGPKYAEVIYSNRWHFSGRLVKAEEYEVEQAPSVPMQKERVVEFNPEFDPNKEGSSIVTAQTVLRRESELDRHLKDLGYDPFDVSIRVIGHIESKGNGEFKTPREKKQEDLWTKWTHKGFKARGGQLFVSVDHGPNDGRKDKVQFVRADVAAIVEDFNRNGARWGARSTEAKEAGYMGLMLPGTIRIEQYIGLDIQPEHMVLTPSYKKVFKGQHVDFVDVTTGTVTLDTVRDVIQNMFDGQSMFHLSDKLLSQYLEGKTPEEKRQICKKLRGARTFTIRAPWCKGLTLTTVDFHSVLRKLGVRKVVSFGRVVDIDDIAILADETVCKATFGQKECHYTNWDEYCENWHRLGHHFCVLLTEHADKPHNLSFQQMQSMVGCKKEDLDASIADEIAKLKGYTSPKKAAGLVGGTMAKIVANVPGLHKHPWVAAREQATYDKLVRQAKAGVRHGVTSNCFVAADPSAMLQWIAYVSSDISDDLQKKYTAEEYVTGSIEAETVICAVRNAGDEAVMSRNPSTDPAAQCVVKVKKDFGEFDKYISWSTTVYTSVHSLEVTKIRGDHDGDHVFICFVTVIIAMAKEANRIHGGRLIDWVAPSTEKHPVNKENMADYFATLTRTSQLGHWCDILTSLVGFGLVGYNHEVACWLTMAVNVFVDASKHGIGDVAVPQFVLDFLQVKDAEGNAVLDENGKPVKRPMPIYAMQVKDNKNITRKEKKVGSKRCAKKYGCGNGDRQALAVQNNVPTELIVNLEGLPVTGVNGYLKEIQYDSSSDNKDRGAYGLRGCDELFAKGTYNKELGIYEGQGLWKEICFERAHELKEIQDTFANQDDDKFAYHAAKSGKEKFRLYYSIRRLREWAEANGKSFEEVYDAITYYTFKLLVYPTIRKNETAEELEKRVQIFNIMFEAWIAILGGMCLRAIYLHDKAVADGTFVEEVDEVDDSFMEDFA